MTNRPEEWKLRQLRGKTDRQLIALITSSLDRGVNSVRLDSDLAAAERICREARALLSVVYGASRTERRRLEAGLAELEQLLHGVPACAGMTG